MLCNFKSKKCLIKRGLSMKQRFRDLDVAKSLMILLVVIGHLSSGNIPINTFGAAWLRKTIYYFHMSLFMYLSGYTMYISFPTITNSKEFILYIKKRAQRLLIPFLFFGSLVFLGKIILSYYVTYSRAPNLDSILGDIYVFISNPSYSKAGYLWFLYVLFQLNIVFSILLSLFSKILKSKFMFILHIVAVILFFIEAPKILELNKFFTYLPFFQIGIHAAARRETFTQIRWSKCFHLAFILSIVLLPTYVPYKFTFFLISIAAIASIHTLCKHPFLQNNKHLLMLSPYVFSIYLFNSPIMGLADKVIYSYFTRSGIVYWAIAPFILMLGVIIPIIIKDKILSKQNFIKV